MSTSNYHGAFGEYSHAAIYDSINSKASSDSGAKIQLNNTVVPVKLSMDNMPGAPVFREGLSLSIRDKFGDMLGSALDNSKTEQFATLAGNKIAAGGQALNIGINTIDSGITTAARPVGQGITVINSYIAPTVKSLEDFGKLGKEFDDIIKQTFISQLFNIKGTEMLCTAFCILVSFLDCNTRNQLKDSIDKAEALSYQASQTVKAINDVVGTYNAAMAGASTVSSAASSLFGTKKLSDILKSPFQQQGTGMNAVGGVATMIAVPASIKQTIKQINALLQLVSKAKISLPVGTNAGIWDLASSVLFAMQAQVVHMADEMLSKVVKPVEQKLKRMMPQNCVGNLASVFFNKILDSIKRFKQWILLQIAELFAANNSFGLKYKTFGLNCQSLLELRFLMQALNLAVVHFAELAKACGVTPCKNADEKLRQAINSGRPAPMTNIPANTGIASKIPVKTNNLDQIATALAPILRLPVENIITGPNHSVTAIYPGYTSVPKKISDLINAGVLQAELGPGYTVYPLPTGGASVVYQYTTSTCGE